MRFSYAVVGAEKVEARLKGLGPEVSRQAQEAVFRLTYELESYVKQNKLSGQVLHVRSGNLRNSVNSQFRQVGTQYTGSVGTGIAYGAIHEYGGDIQRQAGVVTMYRSLNKLTGEFNNRGRLVRRSKSNFATDHAHGSYTITMPERSFLRSSLADMADTIRAGLREAVRGALR